MAEWIRFPFKTSTFRMTWLCNMIYFKEILPQKLSLSEISMIMLLSNKNKNYFMCFFLYPAFTHIQVHLLGVSLDLSVLVYLNTILLKYWIQGLCPDSFLCPFLPPSLSFEQCKYIAYFNKTYSLFFIFHY